ncbi:MAG: hypothetical protein J6Y58_02525 [Clostridiales bacterium]|nr:hypothetical protein [Clostridiales bacterium]
MEKAYVCPKCGASVILVDESEKTCCFCHAELQDKDENKNPKGGFYIGSMGTIKMRRSTCGKCGKSMFSAVSGDVKASRCICCGSDDLISSPEDLLLPENISAVPFSCSREEAVEEYLKSVKRMKIKQHSYAGEEYTDAITPVYVPIIFYDYHIFGNAILSVVPNIKTPRGRGEKFLSVVLLNDFTLERSSSVATPYPKTMNSEMAWQAVPQSASTAIRMEKLDEVSPILRGGAGAKDASLSELTNAVILDIDRSAEVIEKEFMTRIKAFVKECLVTENLMHFNITSYVDKTNYQPALGQLIFIPMWILKIKKKEQCLTWYLNAVSGKSSEVSWESLEEKPAVIDEEPTLKTMNKKRIKAFTIEDFGPEDKPVNYRTFMIDIVASSIASEMMLNEMSADKSLLHLEKQMRKTQQTVSVPVIEKAYQAEVEEQVQKSKEQPIPSKPVPLPSEHSPLFLMREEANNRSLGRGKRLPEKPLDRKVGNEDQFDTPETPSSVAVEFGLADLPEYDPAGPNPFKK